jgi:hypothetical protein
MRPGRRKQSPITRIMPMSAPMAIALRWLSWGFSDWLNLPTLTQDPGIMIGKPPYEPQCQGRHRLWALGQGPRPVPPVLGWLRSVRRSRGLGRRWRGWRAGRLAGSGAVRDEVVLGQVIEEGKRPARKLRPGGENVFFVVPTDQLSVWTLVGHEPVRADLRFCAPAHSWVFVGSWLGLPKYLIIECLRRGNMQMAVWPGDFSGRLVIEGAFPGDPPGR